MQAEGAARGGTHEGALRAPLRLSFRSAAKESVQSRGALCVGAWRDGTDSFGMAGGSTNGGCKRRVPHEGVLTRALYGPLYVCHSAAQRRNPYSLRGPLCVGAWRDGTDSFGMTGGNTNGGCKRRVMHAGVLTRALYGPLYVCHSAAQRRNPYSLVGRSARAPGVMVRIPSE